MYEHGECIGIRDTTGYLLHFNRVNRYDGQDERYRQELDRRRRLVDLLLATLRSAR